MKYYNLSKIIVVVLLLIGTASAYTLDSSGANPNKIFKCQEAIVTANFSNYSSITAVTAIFTNQRILLHGITYHNVTTKSMSNSGLGVWTTTFGGDPNMLWGSRTISFSVTEGTVTTASTGAKVLVYSDTCTGTVTNYTQVSSGLGRYTSMLYTGKFSFIGTSLETSLIGWALFPWIEIWGYLFYVLVMFTIVVTIYLKTQSVVQPIAVSIFLLLIFASSFIVEPIYRQWIIFILALAMTALYYRIFMRD